MGYKPITSKDPHSKFLKDLFKQEFSGTSIRALKYVPERDIYNATVFSGWNCYRSTTSVDARIEGVLARNYYKNHIGDGFFSIHA